MQLIESFQLLSFSHHERVYGFFSSTAVLKILTSSFVLFQFVCPTNAFKFIWKLLISEAKAGLLFLFCWAPLTHPFYLRIAKIGLLSPLLAPLLRTLWLMPHPLLDKIVLWREKDVSKGLISKFDHASSTDFVFWCVSSFHEPSRKPENPKIPLWKSD